MGRHRLKNWCAWGDRPCSSACPTDAIDNLGQPYKACPDFRIKTQAEIDAMCRPAVNESNAHETNEKGNG